MDVIPLKITQAQRNNLAQLAAFLVTIPDPALFGMSYFHIHRTEGHKVEKPIDAVDQHGCGSISCAVGWGTAAGIEAFPGEGWTDYAGRAFGAEIDVEIIEGENDDQRDREALWEWCFDAMWSSTDDTPAGASARIRWALEHDGVPANWVKQRRGGEPLCYKVGE